MASRTAINATLKAFEKDMKSKTGELTMAEYIKLLQISKELAEDKPKEIKVEWVESPNSTEA